MKDEDDDQKPAAMAAMPDAQFNVNVNDNADFTLASALAGEEAQHNHDEQAKQESSEHATMTMPDFTISNLRRKNASGALICMAVGCEKNAQARTKINDAGGFCRIHYNAWLISTGQVESWDCACGNKVSVGSDRCGSCHRWKEKRSHAKAIEARAVKNEKGNDEVAITHVPENAGVQIANVRLTNEKGRSLCKVMGCSKLDQAKNDGFCRFHFNMFSIVPLPNNSINDAIDHVNWTCVCGELISGKQKRCGKCNKWRGGKREPYTTVSKKARMATGNISSDILQGHWTCDCGNSVPSTKSRCGKCHHWRGGKRKGGWKIRPTHTSGGDGGVEWSQDWQCCEVMMAAKKRRCGKCHKWRGGKRFSMGSSVSGGAPVGKVDEYAITEFI